MTEGGNLRVREMEEDGAQSEDGSEHRGEKHLRQVEDGPSSEEISHQLKSSHLRRIHSCPFVDSTSRGSRLQSPRTCMRNGDSWSVKSRGNSPTQSGRRRPTQRRVSVPAPHAASSSPPRRLRIELKGSRGRDVTREISLVVKFVANSLDIVGEILVAKVVGRGEGEVSPHVHLAGRGCRRELACPV